MMTRSQDLSSIVDGVFTAAVRFRAAHGLARGEQGVGVLGIEKVERADVRPDHLRRCRTGIVWIWDFP